MKNKTSAQLCYEIEQIDLSSSDLRRQLDAIQAELVQHLIGDDPAMMLLAVRMYLRLPAGGVPVIRLSPSTSGLMFWGQLMGNLKHALIVHTLERRGRVLVEGLPSTIEEIGRVRL